MFWFHSHKMTWVGRELKDLLVPTPLSHTALLPYMLKHQHLGFTMVISWVFSYFFFPPTFFSLKNCTKSPRMTLPCIKVYDAARIFSCWSEWFNFVDRSMTLSFQRVQFVDTLSYSILIPLWLNILLLSQYQSKGFIWLKALNTFFPS